MIARNVYSGTSVLIVALALQSCVGIFNSHPGSRGRVVDSRSGAPIEGAQIIAGTAYDAKVFRSRRDGTFTIPQRGSLGITLLALAPVDDDLFVSAPGYQTAHVKIREIAPTGSAPQHELGAIRLLPSRHEKSSNQAMERTRTAVRCTF